jgi:ubiquitin-activating enzyme E1
MDRVPQYQLFLEAILEYREKNAGKFPESTNQDQIKAVLARIKELNEKLDEKIPDNEFNEGLLLKLISTASGDLSPMASVFGGIVAQVCSQKKKFKQQKSNSFNSTQQEVIKASSMKYTPINQWLLFDSLECLSDQDPISTPQEYVISVGLFFSLSLKKKKSWF